VLRPALATGTVKALAHITGGGLPENVPRVLPTGVDAEVRLGSWPVPPLFRLVAEVATGLDVHDGLRDEPASHLHGRRTGARRVVDLKRDEQPAAGEPAAQELSDGRHERQHRSVSSAQLDVPAEIRDRVQAEQRLVEGSRNCDVGDT